MTSEGKYTYRTVAAKRISPITLWVTLGTFVISLPHDALLKSPFLVNKVIFQSSGF